MFSSSSYVFGLAVGADGSSTPVPLGAVQATDPEGGTVTYALASGDAGLFAVDADTGAVTYVGPGEGGPGQHQLQVTAADSEGKTATATVGIRVTDGTLPPPTGGAGAAGSDRPGARASRAGLELPAGGLLTPFGLYGRSQYGRRMQLGLLVDRLGPLGLEVSGERYAPAQQSQDDFRMTVLGRITFGDPDAAPGRR